MRVNIINEDGLDEAMLGLSLSYNKEIKNGDEMFAVAKKLASKDGGHNKFLESIVIWIDITAPRYWWQQFDTYRIGITKQSDSTMHTIMKRPLTQEDFETPIPEYLLMLLNAYIVQKNFDAIKNILPEGFLQRRVVCTNYKVIRNIIKQRETHKLKEWQVFCSMREQLNTPELLGL